MGKMNFWFRSGRHNGSTIEERFWEKVDKKSENECWEWLAPLTPRGYGCFNNPISTVAHRLSWIFVNGEIPKGLYVCHKCDNRKCVNPNHLFLGTQTDNMRDMINKGRAYNKNGEKNPAHKLTRESVSRIIEMRKSGYTTIKLAEIFGVKHTAISRVCLGKTWKELK